MKTIKEYTNVITKLILLLLLGTSSLVFGADNVSDIIPKAVAGDKHAIQQLEDVARQNKHKGLNGILATIYERGLGGTSTDYQKAEEFYTKHLQESHGEATEIYNKLGDMYSNNLANYEQKAQYYYAKAIEKSPNDPKAYGRLGMIYAYGEGIKLDYAKAKQLLEKAIALNTDNTNVYDGLALIYGGMGGTIPTDAEGAKRAVELFKKSCQMGSKKGCDMLNKIKNELESTLNK